MRGSKTTIWLLCADENDCQPLEYIEGLDQKERKKVDVLLEFTSDHGPHHDEKRFKRLEGPIFEFKPYGIRLLCFQTNEGFVIARGHNKSKKRITQREIEKANALREAFLNGRQKYVGTTE